MEFWVGWFDHWGNGGHTTGNLDENMHELNAILERGSVNIYLFHGGTNFGFMNGSNYYDKLTPDVTSYDYDALLTESGDFTQKYYELQKVISKYTELPEVNFTTAIEKKEYGQLTVKAKTGLFESLDELSSPQNSVSPMSMEKCGQNYGYILYETNLITQRTPEKIQLCRANDRAHIYLDNTLDCILYDKELLDEKKLNVKSEYNRLSILMENMGRVNFGYKMNSQRKGIDGDVLINGRIHNNWCHYTLPLNNIGNLTFTKGYTSGNPAFYKFEFKTECPADTFLDFEGWGKGCIFVNNYNIGRFWSIGPQKRLYIPAPLLRKGENTIIIFETDGLFSDTIKLTSSPDLG